MSGNASTNMLENKIKHILKLMQRLGIDKTIELDGNTVRVDGRHLIRGTKNELYRHLNTFEAALWLMPERN